MAAKNNNGFKRFYTIYVAVLVIALIALFFYVRGVMVEYENNTADAYILTQISKSADSKTGIYEYIEENCFSADAAAFGNPKERESTFRTLAAGNLKIEASETSPDTGVINYVISSDEKPYLIVGMKEENTYTKLGILTMSDWSIEYAFLRNPQSEAENIVLNDDGKLECKVSYTEGFTLLIDDTEYSGTDKAVRSEHPDFVYVAPYTDTPSLYTLSFELSFEPEFSARNNAGTVVSATETGNGTYEIPAEFEPSEEAETFIASLNPTDRAMLWSKFMTNDVGGSNYGFATVVEECGLYEGTNLYTLARNWSRNIDIRFVSLHTITSWTNESVTNCVKYNDTLYSCDVYIEKNMHLKNGADRTDVFYNRMYFADVNGTWYLIDMFSLEANQN